VSETSNLRARVACLAVLLLGASTAAASAQSVVPFVGLGDSIGESVQSADASEWTQPWSFLNLIAWRMGAPFPLPLIRTNPFGTVGNTAGRTRIDPSVRTLNLAVSGADAHSLLFDAANAGDVSEINSETDLVLFPWRGSQIQIAEALRPAYVACWIGNNEALGAALAVDHMDASQLTPLPRFAADFEQIAARLQAAGSKVVFGTVPDVTHIAFLLDRQDLVRFLGSDFGLPDGSRTSMAVALIVKLGLADGSVFSNPDFVLDQRELQIISDHVRGLNAIIRSVAAAHGMAVADVHDLFEYIAAFPLTIGNVVLTPRFLGGLFSLDGVHPSNVSQAIVANVFLDRFNQFYGTSFPPIDYATLFAIFFTDPFVDKDGDGRVAGRFGVGLVETLLPFLGLSGDLNDLAPSSPVATQSSTAIPPSPIRFLNEYQRRTGRDLRLLSQPEQMRALHDLFDASGVGSPKNR